MRRLTLCWLLMLGACPATGTDPNSNVDGGTGANNSVVATIELSPDSLFLTKGKTAQLSAFAYDEAGHLLGDVAFTYSTSDSAVASVDGSVVTGLGEGFSQVTAKANGKESNPCVVIVAPEMAAAPSSQTLIADAQASGALDAETALQYRVFAAFKDSRLPLIMQGNDESVVDADVLEEVAMAWSTLSEPTRDIIEPFLMPPAYLGSWASLDRYQRRLLGLCQAPAIDPNWAFLPATGGHFKVWYDTRVAKSQAQAQLVSDALANVIYPAVVTGLGMKPPLSDGTKGGCNGGDDRLDVYLSNLGAAGAVNSGETKPTMAGRKFSAVFLMLNRNLSDDKLLGTAAHEFTHACQWAYDVSGAFLDSYKWLKEATAQEALDHVYPTNPLDHETDKLNAFLNEPERPIEEADAKNQFSRHYGSYLFFQFLVRSGSPSVIGTIWNATLTANQLDAVDKGVPGGLKKQWPDFARVLWNADPVSKEPKSFTLWDSMKETPFVEPEDGNLMGAKEGEITLPDEVKHLAVNYTQVTFSEPETRSLLFHNTFYSLARAMKSIHVQALFKDSTGIWSEEDWTEQEYIGFCRDQKDQRIDELIIIVSNADPAGGSLTAPEAATLKRNNMPCWGLEGTASRVTKKGSSGTSKVTANLVYGKGPTTQITDPSRGYLRMQVGYPLFESGSASLDEDYYDGSGCRYVANASLQLTSSLSGGDTSGLWVINIYPAELPPELAEQQTALIGPNRRAYSGDVASTKLVNGVVTATGSTSCPSSYVADVSAIMHTQVDSAEQGGHAQLAKDDGSFVGSLTDGDSTYTWNMKARREP